MTEPRGPKQFPELVDLVVVNQLILEWIRRNSCEWGRTNRLTQCMSAAQHARFELYAQIIDAQWVGRPLDPEYIRTETERIDEQERSCLDRAEQTYRGCVAKSKSAEIIIREAAARAGGGKTR